MFNGRQDGKRTWEWAIENLDQTDRKIFLMEPGTWWILDVCEIHACISLTPCVHASQEFFHVGDAQKILDIWSYTADARAQSEEKRFVTADLPEELPERFGEMEGLDSVVANAIKLYNDAREILVTGKSDQVTDMSELCTMLPVVRDWIEREAAHRQRQ